MADTYLEQAHLIVNSVDALCQDVMVHLALLLEFHLSEEEPNEGIKPVDCQE